MRIAAVCLILAGFVATATGQVFEGTGVGGGGWLQSGAFHPTDPNTILIGGDFAGGIYRTTNFGDSWEPCNHGLENHNEYDSHYVEDILGFSDDGRTGFIAATYGGIYWLEDGVAEWELQTPADEYWYKVNSCTAESVDYDPENYIPTEFEGPGVSYQIPFSCLTAVGTQVFAGAGRVRWGLDWETGYYPGLPASDQLCGFGGSWQSETDQYTVWKRDTSAPPPWVPFDQECTFGAARDISAADVNGEILVAVATPTGIRLWNGSAWDLVSDRDLVDHVGSTNSGYYPEDLTCWSLHLTSRGTLYAAMEMKGDGPVSGVYRIHDVRDPTDRWHWVGNGEPAGPLGTVEAAGESCKTLLYLTVVDGEVLDADTLYLGSRLLHYGLYRGTREYDGPGNAGSWQEIIYSVNIGDGSELYDGNGGSVDRGWMEGLALVMFHPAVFPGAPGSSDRLAVQLNGRFHVSEDGGETWLQRYTEGGPSGWNTKGYDETGIMDMDVDSSGNLYLSAADNGVLKSVDDFWTVGTGQFANINPRVNPDAAPGDTDIWNHESSKMVIVPNWRGGGKDAIAVHYGEIVSKSLPGKIMIYTEDDGWENVTGQIGDLDRYLFPDFTFVDQNTIFAIYLEFKESLLGKVNDERFVRAGVMRFDHNGTDWNWAKVDDGLRVAPGDTVNVNRAYGSAILYHQASGRIFLASQFINYTSEKAVPPANLPTGGSLYYLDGPDDLTWECAFLDEDIKANFRDIRSLAQPANGDPILYVGTRGRSLAGFGSVLKMNPADLNEPVVWLANSDETDLPFQFQAPLWLESRSELYINRLMTGVYSITVDPDDSDQIYCDLVAKGFAAQAGLWHFDGTAWHHMSENEPFVGMSVMSTLVTGTTPKVLACGTSGQGAYFTTLDSAPVTGPTIADDAAFPILADNPDTTTAIAVEVTHLTGGYQDMTVHLDATGMGGPANIPLLDDGVFPDLEDDDNVYTSPLMALPVAAGTHTVSVTAFAGPACGGDGSMTEDHPVQVEAINSLLKFSDATDKTGDLARIDNGNPILTGNPYSEVYFDTPLGGSQERLLLVTKEDDDPLIEPQVFSQTPVIIEGTPEFDERTNLFQGTPPPPGSRGLCVGDVDGDGDEDIFIGHYGGSAGLWLNDETGTGFTNGTGQFFAAEDLVYLQNSHAAAWGDYNNDGFLDLAVASLNQSQWTLDELDAQPDVGSTISLFRNLGDRFERVTHTDFPTDVTVLSMAWNDVNGDRNQDLLLFGFNETASNPQVYFNQGWKSLQEDNTLVLNTNWGSPGSVRSMAWTDFDHDDDEMPDLVWATNDSVCSGEIWKNTGTGFDLVGAASLGGVFETVLVGDLDQNGQDDIGFIPTIGVPVKFLLPYQEGSPLPELVDDGPTVGIAAGGLPEGQYASGGVFADFNDDHDLDVLIGWPVAWVDTTGNLIKMNKFFYRNVRPDFDSGGDYVEGKDDPVIGQQNWLQVDLTSSGSSNRSCIGAQVIVQGCGRQWMQTVDGGSGRGGQNPNQLHFGLGDCAGPVSVEVRWPLPYATSTVADLTVNQVVAVTEGDGGCLTIPPRSVKFSHRPFPGGSDWVFEWSTDEKGDLMEDMVEWRYQDGEQMDHQCLGSLPGVLRAGDPGVRVMAYPYKGSWVHRLIWENQICSPVACPFEFTATSGVDGCTTTSGWTAFGDFGICIE